jgi:hypothetical protein
LLKSLKWDKLIAWVEVHTIVPQGKAGKCTKKGNKKGKEQSILFCLSTYYSSFVDMLKAIMAALKAKQPTREDLENIINEVCLYFAFLVYPFAQHSFQCTSSKHNVRAAMQWPSFIH